MNELTKLQEQEQAQAQQQPQQPSSPRSQSPSPLTSSSGSITSPDVATQNTPPSTSPPSSPPSTMPSPPAQPLQQSTEELAPYVPSLIGGPSVLLQEQDIANVRIEKFPFEFVCWWINAHDLLHSFNNTFPLGKNAEIGNCCTAQPGTASRLPLLTLRSRTKDQSSSL